MVPLDRASVSSYSLFLSLSHGKCHGLISGSDCRLSRYLPMFIQGNAIFPQALPCESCVNVDKVLN